MKKPTDYEVKEFLKESNAIENEFSQIAYEDANQAWITAVINKEEFSIELMLAIHRRLMKRLNKEIAGKIRDIPVYVGNSNGYKECMKPELIRPNLEKLFEKWENRSHNLNEGVDIKTKEEWIKQWHIDFEHIHPFQDGNGRTGRILMNIQRLILKLPLLIIHTGPEQFEYYKWFKPKEEIK
jgi:Fic family protein